MSFLNPVSRFFLNRSAGRRDARRLAWLRPRLQLPVGAACLEVGAGNADLAARLTVAYRPERYVATDADPRQVEAADRHLRRTFPGGLPPGLEVRTADMRELPFPEASWDAVFAFVALHHASPSHRQYGGVPEALAEIARVLRPGGLLVYEEIVHRDRIRAWLGEHRFSIVAEERRRWRDRAIVRKANGEVEDTRAASAGGRADGRK